MKYLMNMSRKQVQFILFNETIKIPAYKLIIFLLVVVYFLARHFLLTGIWFTLTNETYNFSIEYPAAWNANSYGKNGSRGSNSIRAEVDQNGFFNSGSVNIYQQWMENPKLTDAVEWGQPMIQRNNGYNLSPLREVQVGSGQYSALTQTYQTKDGLGELSKLVYLVTNNDIFIIEFNDLQSRFDKNEPTFDRMLASFRIIE